MQQLGLGGSRIFIYIQMGRKGLCALTSAKSLFQYGRDPGSVSFISVRDEFRLGGAVQSLLPEYLFPLLARRSSGFARILPDFCPKNGYLEHSRGAAAHLTPMAGVWSA